MREFELGSLLKASVETCYMVFIAGFIGIAVGTLLGAGLFILGKKNHPLAQLTYRLGEFLINATRSLPFIILMIAIIPFTRLLVGSSIGIHAAIVPLTIAAIPFYARITQNALAAIPFGLIEAAHAMGISSFHLMTKVLIPESMPSLIRGASLTVIGLIGYSAMAGVIGGGGLGELAINYGYQRFDVAIMLETIIILIVIVQLVQFIGDKLALRHPTKYFFLSLSLIFFLLIGYGSWYSSSSKTDSIRIGIMSGWSEEVMALAKQMAKEKYNLNLEIVTFTDYVQPNAALNNYSIDANIFQHAPYLNEQIRVHHYKLFAVAKTFVYPMGFFSTKIKHISQLKKGAVIAIQNDPSNGTRALLLMQKAGLIKLKSTSSGIVSLADIQNNPLHLQFKLLDPAQLPRALQDADLVAINNDFLAPTGLTLKNAILKEGEDSPYANLIVVRQEDKDKSEWKKLINIMHSKPILEKTETIFPDGAVIPAWKE